MRSAYFLVFILILFLNCTSFVTSDSKSLFRHINLHRYGKIKLGTRVEKYEDLLIIKNNKKYLKKNTFGGADSIQIIPTSTGKIKALIFRYSSNTDLKSKINDYTYLGTYLLNNKKVVWSDGNTKYEIYEEKKVVYSVLTDLKK